MATDSVDPMIGHNSYADLVVQKYGGNGSFDFNENCWLVQFLQNGHSNSSVLLDNPIEIYILDSINGNLGNSSFTAHRRTPVETVFLEILHSSSSQRRTRLIMLQCQRMRDVNELYINAISLRYELDPYFFSALFDQCLILAQGRRVLQSNQPALPPSKRQFMQ
jgi:hypothetical protein